ncbi:hypothetical protein DFJ77DRAFT_479830 [Powellomyces hirtus]|nr:hypothetical protein DFJ77DRAFT_479830 [Powellomyces hirtus]
MIHQTEPIGVLSDDEAATSSSNRPAKRIKREKRSSELETATTPATPEPRSLRQLFMSRACGPGLQEVSPPRSQNIRRSSPTESVDTRPSPTPKVRKQAPPQNTKPKPVGENVDAEEDGDDESGTPTSNSSTPAVANIKREPAVDNVDSGAESVTDDIKMEFKVDPDGTVALDIDALNLARPEGIPADAAQRPGFHRFDHITENLGGSGNDTIPSIAATRTQITEPGYRLRYGAFKKKWNPDLPEKPGAHGASLTTEYEGRLEVFIQFLKHSGGNSWWYAGTYECFPTLKLAKEDYRSLPEATKKTWSRALATKNWGKKWIKSQGFDLSGIPQSEHASYIENAFHEGQLTHRGSILQCIGYNEDLYQKLRVKADEFDASQVNIVRKQQARAKSSRKRRGRATSEVSENSDSD